MAAMQGVETAVNRNIKISIGDAVKCRCPWKHDSDFVNNRTKVNFFFFFFLSTYYYYFLRPWPRY